MRKGRSLGKGQQLFLYRNTNKIGILSPLGKQSNIGKKFGLVKKYIHKKDKNDKTHKNCQN